MFFKKNIIFLWILISIIGAASVGLYYFKFSTIKTKREDIKRISVERGVIQDLDSKIIKIKSEKSVPLSQDRENNDNYVVTTYFLDKDTKIYKYVNRLKDTEEYYQEKSRFNQKIEKLKKEGKDVLFLGLEVPSRYMKKEINWRDLKQGEEVKVFFYEDKGELIVQKVIVLSEIKPKITPFPPMTDNDFKFFGQIKEVSLSQILLNINNINPTATSSFGEVKSILVDNDTRVVKKIKKTEEEFKKEQNEYRKQLQSLGDNVKFDNLKAPDWFKEYKIKLTDLKKGDKVKVKAILNGDNKYLAKKIECYSN